MESYFHLESYTNDKRNKIYREVKSIPATELESTIPTGLTASSTKWMSWLRVVPFFKF